MANTVIQLKHSTLTGNVPSSLANGEISINSRDGKFFYSTPAGVVVTHYPYPGPAGLNQEIQFNDSGVLGSDSGLTYNKTTDVITVVGGAIVGGVNVTPQIQLAFTQANTPSHVANSAASYANGAFAKANTQDAINLTQNNSITAAFTRANNSLNSNTGGTVTANTTFSGNVFLTGNGTTLSVTSNLSFISPNTQNTITARMINGGTLSFSSNSGELFSITDSLAQGSIFSVNDISGLPIIDVDANGFISLVQYGGNVHIYNAATSVSNSTGALVVDGGVGVKGNVYADAIYDSGIEIIAYANSAFLAANTPSHVANSAASYANSGFSVSNSAASYANSGFTQANSNYTSAVTKLNVTHSGSSAYLIDQYTGNNPSIYVSGGETIAFNLNVSGHPFVIRESSGGANTSTGLTHVSTTGVVSTGASAQGYVTGVLYWKVPFSLVGSTYVYQCTIHGGMVGNIVIQQPASFVAANTTLAFIAANTPSHTANSAASYANGAFAAANSAGGAASAGSYANSAFTTANSSGSYANSAFAAANSASGAASAGSYANSAFLKANTPSHVANSAASYANSAFSTANTTITVGSYANSAFTLANSANIIAQGAYNFANTISGGSAIDNVARTSANSAGSYANSAFIHANSAFAVANTGGVTIGDVLALSIALG